MYESGGTTTLAISCELEPRQTLAGVAVVEVITGEGLTIRVKEVEV